MNPSLSTNIAAAAEVTKTEALNQAAKERWSQLEQSEVGQDRNRTGGRAPSSEQSVPTKARPSDTGGQLTAAVPERSRAGLPIPGDPSEPSSLPTRAAAGVGSGPEATGDKTAAPSGRSGDTAAERPGNGLDVSTRASASPGMPTRPDELETATNRGSRPFSPTAHQQRSSMDQPNEPYRQHSAGAAPTANQGRTPDGHNVSLKHALDAQGAPSAARTLFAAVHALPANLAAAYLARSSATILQIADRLCLPPCVDPGGSKQIAVRASRETASAPALVLTQSAQTLAFAHIANALNGGAGFETTRHLVRDLAAIIVGSLSLDEEAALQGFTFGASIGQGALLPLAIARELEDRNDRRRLRTLYRLIAAALGGMLQRVDASWAALEEFAGPLIFASRGWQAELDLDDYIWQVGAYLDRNPAFLIEFVARLDRVAQVGREAMRTLDDLVTAPADAVLDAARRALLASDATRLSIAHSPAAHREALRMAKSRSQDDADGPTLDAVRLVFLDIGFTAPHDAYLADAALTQRFTSPLRAGWTRIENLDAINRDGRAFQRLLGFLNGTFVVPVQLDVLALEDIELPGA